MNLSLLAPFALAAAALAAVPLYLHLVDRQKVPRQDFPALRFLLKAQKRLRHQSRIRDRGLLLVRILALLALVLAAASPLFEYEESLPAGADLGKNVVFLLDRSLSMGYQLNENERIFDRAQARIKAVVSRLPEGSQVGLVLFDAYPEELVGGLSSDPRRVSQKAKEAEVGLNSTDLRGAVQAGLRALLSTPEAGGDLYLLSDSTETSLPGDAPLDLPKQLKGRVRLIVAKLFDEELTNQAVFGAKVEGGERGGKIIASVFSTQGGSATDAPPNGKAEKDVSLEFLMNGEVVSQGLVSVSPGQTTEKVFSMSGQTTLNGLGTLRLASDNLPADDAFYFPISQRRRLKVLVVDGDPGMNLADGESFFIERALSPLASSGSRITPLIVAPGSLPKLDPSEVAAVFLLNVGDPAALAPRLTDYVKNGGALFISVGDNVNPERYNRALRGLLPATLGQTISAAPDVTGEQPPTLTHPPVGHPVFRVFREAGAEVFAQTHFYRMIPTSPKLKADAEVLLKFSTGLPALLARRVGKGQVFFWASSLDRAWTDFPLKSIFLPFIQESVHYLSGNPLEGQAVLTYETGQSVTLVVPESTGKLSVSGPDSEAFHLEEAGQETTENGASMKRLLLKAVPKAGIYRVFEAPEEGGQLISRGDLDFVVNVSRGESDLSPLKIERLKKLLPEVPVLVEGQGEDSQKTVTVERSRKLAQPLLWALMLFLLFEGFMMARRSVRQS